jgi:hypothetical protein
MARPKAFVLEKRRKKREANGCFSTKVKKSNRLSNKPIFSFDKNIYGIVKLKLTYGRKIALQLFKHGVVQVEVPIKSSHEQFLHNFKTKKLKCVSMQNLMTNRKGEVLTLDESSYFISTCCFNEIKKAMQCYLSSNKIKLIQGTGFVVNAQEQSQKPHRDVNDKVGPAMALTAIVSATNNISTLFAKGSHLHTSAEPSIKYNTINKSIVRINPRHHGGHLKMTIFDSYLLHFGASNDSEAEERDRVAFTFIGDSATCKDPMRKTRLDFIYTFLKVNKYAYIYI